MGPTPAAYFQVIETPRRNVHWAKAELSEACLETIYSKDLVLYCSQFLYYGSVADNLAFSFSCHCGFNLKLKKPFIYISASPAKEQPPPPLNSHPITHPYRRLDTCRCLLMRHPISSHYSISSLAIPLFSPTLWFDSIAAAHFLCSSGMA